MDIEQFKQPPPDDDTPIANKLIEDGLAHMPTEDDRITFLECMIWLGFEYLAREAGRSHATDRADHMAHFVRTAQPVRPWPN